MANPKVVVSDSLVFPKSKLIEMLTLESQKWSEEEKQAVFNASQVLHHEVERLGNENVTDKLRVDRVLERLYQDDQGCKAESKLFTCVSADADIVGREEDVFDLLAQGARSKTQALDN